MQRDKNYPDNQAEGKRDKARMMEGVYAGPDFFAQTVPPIQQNPQMFMATYAGPEPPALSGPIGAFAPPAEPDKADRWCVSCGTGIRSQDKFCPECGAPQPKSDA